MEFLQTLGSPEVWEAYYAYCAGREHITKRELSQLRRQIDAKAYLTPPDAMAFPGDVSLCGAPDYQQDGEREEARRVHICRR